VLLFKNLQDKLKNIKNELLAAKNEKLVKKNYAEMFIDEMNSLLKENINIDRKKINKEIDDKQEELKVIVNDIASIDSKIKKREALFSNY